MKYPLLSHSDLRRRNIMASRFGNSAATLALGVAIFATPALWNTGSPFTTYLADQELIAFQAQADATDAVVLQAAFERSAPTTVVEAYEALQADPRNMTLQDAYSQALIDAALPEARVYKFETAYANWQNAVEADALAAVAEIESQVGPIVAANKTPMDDATRDTLDAVFVGKAN
jgi:hypothetical protein